MQVEFVHDDFMDDLNSRLAALTPLVARGEMGAPAPEKLLAEVDEMKAELATALDRMGSGSGTAFDRSAYLKYISIILQVVIDLIGKFQS